MMISLGYYFDQVSLERMTQRISGQVELIAASTPVDSPVAPNAVVWIETAHPNYHDLDVAWQLDGRLLPAATGSRNLELRTLGLTAGTHRISVTVTDPTDFVRDPAIRDSSLTATRSWTTGGLRAGAPVQPAFTAATDTARPAAGTEVVYVETTHPADHVLQVRWQLDGRTIANPRNRRTFDLASQHLAPGTHQLRATVSDAASPASGSQTLCWTVDNTGPAVTYQLDAPVAAVMRPDSGHLYFIRDQFTMKLEATDNESGYIVPEFRVDGDGWYQYFGWPDAPAGTPFLFTPRGTTIKALVYGSLSREGLSPQPWEPRAPGWGIHTIEYRARDAAGNIGGTRHFQVALMPAPECGTRITGTHNGELAVPGGTTCLDQATITGAVTIAPGASLFATNSRITGSLTSSGAASVELIATTVQGSTRIGRTSEELTLFASTLQQDVTLTDNATAIPALIAGTILPATLHCTPRRSTACSAQKDPPQ